MRLHVEALFRIDASDRLLTVNEAGGARAPRFFWGRTVEGDDAWFRDDLDVALVWDLRRILGSVSPGIRPEPTAESVASILRRLEEHRPIEGTWAGPAFRIPSSLETTAEATRVTPESASVLTPYFEDWAEDVRRGVPFWAVLEGGRAMSICCSVRTTAHAHEAGVETHAEFRGRGHAAKVVAAWARDVAVRGRIPLYSTSWENAASLAVASKLGLIQFGADLHVT